MVLNEGSGRFHFAPLPRGKTATLTDSSGCQDCRGYDQVMGTEAGDAANHPILQRMVLTTKPNIGIVLKFTNSMLNEESEAQGSRPSYTTYW